MPGLGDLAHPPRLHLVDQAWIGTRTISGSMPSTVWMTAASLNCLNASARRASTLAAASAWLASFWRSASA